MFDLPRVQAAFREDGLDGWLLYDFRGLNVLARRVLDMPAEHMLSRRWFYFIPAQGEPRKLVHRIEPAALDHLPGIDNDVYLRWQELEAGVACAGAGRQRVAMEYVPRNANPYVSRVDAGTVELVRSFGVEIVPSGDLIQRFEACWDDEQWAMHLEAAKHTRSAYDVAFGFIAEHVRSGQVRCARRKCSSVILDHFDAARPDRPIIRRSSPSDRTAAIRITSRRRAAMRRFAQGDFVLIDLWAKLDKPRAVYSDLTRVGVRRRRRCRTKYEKIFQIVAAARDAAIASGADGLRRRAAVCKAGRSIRPRAT